MSKVDVIIPCYKYGHFLRGCVESALSQQGVEVRVLIIDDASPDDTERVGKVLAAEDPRVTFWKHQVNRGHIATYNEGLDWASSEYLLLLSADDLLTPGSLGRAARLLEAHPEVSFAHGRAIKTSDPGAVSCSEPAGDPSEVIPGAEFIRAMCATGENCVETPTVVVRTSVQKEVGGYRKELPHGGDMEMWLRLASHGAVGYIDADQAYYRLHGENMSVGYLNIRDFHERKAVFESFFREAEARLRSWKHLRPVSERGLAENAFWTAHKCFERGEESGCDEYLSFALMMWRKLQYRPAWWSLRAKQFIGSRAWSVIRPMVRRVRGLHLPSLPMAAG